MDADDYEITVLTIESFGWFIFLSVFLIIYLIGILMIMWRVSDGIIFSILDVAIVSIALGTYETVKADNKLDKKINELTEVKE